MKNETLVKFLEGMKVMLSSGGPSMTIIDVDLEKESCTCEWIDDDGETQSHSFLWVCLVALGVK